jgi:hypothetical protein
MTAGRRNNSSRMRRTRRMMTIMMMTMMMMIGREGERDLVYVFVHEGAHMKRHEQRKQVGGAYFGSPG